MILQKKDLKSESSLFCLQVDSLKLKLLLETECRLSFPVCSEQNHPFSSGGPRGGKMCCGYGGLSSVGPPDCPLLSPVVCQTQPPQDLSPSTTWILLYTKTLGQPHSKMALRNPSLQDMGLFVRKGGGERRGCSKGEQRREGEEKRMMRRRGGREGGGRNEGREREGREGEGQGWDSGRWEDTASC